MAQIASVTPRNTAVVAILTFLCIKRVSYTMTARLLHATTYENKPFSNTYFYIVGKILGVRDLMINWIALNFIYFSK